MQSQVQTNDETKLARRVAPEDLARGDFVAALNELIEFPSFLWECDTRLRPPQEVVVVRFKALDAGRPLRVEGVCLPFVFVERPCGARHTIDVRSVEFVRLSKEYAKRVWKRHSSCRSAAGRKKKRS